jgi:hypothetical protein
MQNKFGKLTILKIVKAIDGQYKGRELAECRCDCGTLKTLDRFSPQSLGIDLKRDVVRSQVAEIATTT